MQNSNHPPPPLNLETFQTHLSFINLPQLINHFADHKKSCCLYCKAAFVKDDYYHRRTKDHLIPRCKLKSASLFIRSKLSFLLTVPCCYYCNQLKGDKSLVQFRTYVLNREDVFNKSTILSQLDLLIQA